MSTPAPRPAPPPSSHRSHHPDSVLFNGTVHPLDRPGHTQSALAVKGEHILAAGSDSAILALAGPDTETLNLEGATVLPGLTDAHIHLKKYARALAQVDCGTETAESCLARVADRAGIFGSASDWILGHGWDQNAWGRFGTKGELDAASGRHPAYLTAKSLHAAWANSAAMQLAGIGPETPDPPGGSIQRDEAGQPTGILFEAAMSLVASEISDQGASSLRDDLAMAQERLWSMGLTGVHDFDPQDCFIAIQGLREEGRLGLRIVKNILVEDLPAALDVGLRSGFGDPWIRIGGIKVFADGALGPHTAAMLQPYEGEPGNLGVLLKDEEELVSLATSAADGGLAMTIHAIGDRANHAVLDAYESLRQYELDHRLPRLRHRIEHVQLLHPDDIGRLQSLGLVASMQPIHALSDRNMADKYWGDRVTRAYAWKTQHDLGTPLAFGSDAPVESPNPFLGIYAAVTRGPLPEHPELGPWHPEESIPLWDALRAYTLGPAFASHQEGSVGTLAPGKLADLIVVDKDPFASAAESLLEVNVLGTMVGGSWRLRRF